MTKDQAKQLVRDTFTHRFQKEHFRRFIKELVNRYDEGKAKSWNSQYIPDAFKDHVDRYERLGTFTAAGDGEKVDILIVHLTNDSKLERARTALRNFVAHHLKSRDEKDSGLVAFVSPSEATWRFSFVKMEYVTEEKAGRVSVATHLTPARRFSYLVGEGESCHTAQSRFLSLLHNTSSTPTIDQIAECFSVETVTKDFFNQYYGLFKGLKQALDVLVGKDKAVREEFQKKRIKTEDFAKKLLGQVVFLYFIQKKGWLGVGKGRAWGSGPRDFLRRVAKGEYGNYTNFFNEVLEPLFYDTLATDRSKDGAWCSRFKCRLPFLNGGLFEPLADYNWEATELPLSTTLFFNSEVNSDGDVGTGILDVFDRYNFTVNEAEPLEEEVAIDPEMLGKVFENLLEAESRKSLGTFYTPRAIVQYMCQEALITYLYRVMNISSAPLIPQKPLQGGLFGPGKPVQAVLETTRTEEKVSRDDIAALIHLGDQAAHYEAALKSGTTSYEKKPRPRLPKSIDAHAQALDDALVNIKVCDPAIGSGAFPVGMMTEIIRARLALTPYFDDDTERTPYQFKRHAIHNCIYGVDIDSGAVEIAKLRLWLSLVVDEDDPEGIRPLPNLDFKIVAGNSLLGFPFQTKGLADIEALKDKYFDEADHRRKALLKEDIASRISSSLAQSERSLGYRVDFDFRLIFSEVFRQSGGFDVVIANPPYGLLNKRQNRHESVVVSDNELAYFKTSAEFEPARGGMINVFRLFIVRSINLLREGGCFAEIFPLSFAGDSSAAALRNHLLQRHQLISLEAFPERDNERTRVFEAVKMSVCILLLSAHTGSRQPFALRMHRDRYVDLRNERVLLSPEIIETIDPTTHAIPLLRTPEVALFEKVYKDCVRLGAMGHCFTGEIDLTQDKEYLTDDARSAALLKGAMLDRYLIRETMSQGEILFLKSSAYLRENHGQRSQHHQSRRIVMQGITGVNEHRRLKMTVAEKGTFCANSVNYIILDAGATVDVEYLLAVLNSKLLNFVFAKTSTNSNVNGYEVDNLPIIVAKEPVREKVADLATKVMAAKRRNPDADTLTVEREIDQQVYRIYGLTETDMEVIERGGA